ncbi:hypothetical protein BKA82DRAFT_753185 [Pisolithus tinctorius]|uniref:Uncharacterized protein n=1 Tax=Pisolithus tinctorius Marx 270 TaxID=870435 RepID=A0A0C3NZU2_PISTI|nr:hypothetical protein BKA82DRAFT_753185 [Pisolithus tinctorius]KIO00806.1 hypothetical protein M404DRAFT_753185 [Pisolithus tinctorius Marx 270]
MRRSPSLLVSSHGASCVLRSICANSRVQHPVFVTIAAKGTGWPRPSSALHVTYVVGTYQSPTIATRTCGCLYLGQRRLAGARW